MKKGKSEGEGMESGHSHYARKLKIIWMSYGDPSGVAQVKVLSPIFSTKPCPVTAAPSCTSTRHLVIYTHISCLMRVGFQLSHLLSVLSELGGAGRVFLPLEGMDLNMHVVQYVEN